MSCNPTSQTVENPAHCCPTVFSHDALLNLPSRRRLYLTGVEPGAKSLSVFDRTRVGFVVADGKGQIITNQPTVPIPFLHNPILGSDGRPAYNANGTPSEDNPPGVNDLVVMSSCGTMWRWHGKHGQRQKPVWNGCQWVVEPDLTEAELADFPSIVGTEPGYKEAVLIDLGGGKYGIGYREVRSRIAGEITQFAGPDSGIPQGWLICNGSAYDPGEYPELFANIGYYWGKSGDLFRVPDLRGRFLRGVDDGSGNDPDAASRFAQYSGGASGDEVGSYQRHAITKHGHEWVNSANAAPADTAGDSGIANDSVIATGSAALGEIGNVTGADTSSECRPVNAAIHFIICAGQIVT